MISRFIYIWIFAQAVILNQSHAAQTIQIHNLNFVGDPQSLKSLDKISVDHHAITMHRWSSFATLDEVMRSLSELVPANTVATEDGNIIKIFWSTADQSHILGFIPVREGEFEFFLSSMNLNKKTYANSVYSTQLIDINNQQMEMNKTLNKIFQESNIKAEMLVHVMDESNNAPANTLIYALSTSIDRLDQMLRQTFSQKNWVVKDSLQKIKNLNQARSMTAVYLDRLMHLNLVEHHGQSFLYVSFSGVK